MSSADAEKVEQLKRLNETMSYILAELRAIRTSQQQIVNKTK